VSAMHGGTLRGACTPFWVISIRPSQLRGYLVAPLGDPTWPNRMSRVVHVFKIGIGWSGEGRGVRVSVCLI
jgi:hypothetical protein